MVGLFVVLLLKVVVLVELLVVDVLLLVVVFGSLSQTARLQSTMYSIRILE